MIRYLEVDEVLLLHRSVITRSGGAYGLRDVGALESAIAQPRMSFGGRELYSSVAEKASAMGFSLIANLPFVDGNKRIGHAAMETFLVLNGMEIVADVDEQETVILSIAAGGMKREGFARWLATKVQEKKR